MEQETALISSRSATLCVFGAREDRTMENDKMLIDSARAYVDEVWEDIIQDIDFLVQVESVEDREHAQPGKPFGPAPYEALRRGLSIARRLGLSTHDCEGYMGYADLTGERDDYLATIAHCDIVPLGDDWTFDPLHVTRKEGYLLGRGVLDDKGPLVLSLYAAHYFVRQVKQTGKLLPYTLRCLIGTNEETDMEDLDYYLEHYPEPLFCFSPDASFPVICGEKGIFHASVSSATIDVEAAHIISLNGGSAYNAVPGRAEAIVRADATSLPKCEGIVVMGHGVDFSGQALCRLIAVGKGGHASMPQGTCNAIGKLCAYLLDKGICNDDERSFLEFERALHADSEGVALGIAATDDVFDPLTCIGGTIRSPHEDGCMQFVQTIDVRYPKSVSGDEVLAGITEVAKHFGCAVTLDSDADAFFMEPDTKEINTLLSTYNQMTGRNEKAITIGGGTYARHFSRAAAFGPEDTSLKNPSWVGIEHGHDEGVFEDSLKQALAIYIVSIARLMQLEL